jgi:GTP-binding protein Era
MVNKGLKPELVILLEINELCQGETHLISRKTALNYQMTAVSLGQQQKPQLYEYNVLIYIEGDIMANQGKTHRAGYVAVMGRPNVGKSTLINALLGQKIAAVSPRPQTTRSSQLGILSKTDGQIVFVDTPGLHKPHHKLGEYMNQKAEDVLADSDLILFIVDGSKTPPDDEDKIIINLLNEMQSPPPVILVINKIDRIEPGTTKERVTEYQALYPPAKVAEVSATRGTNLDNLVVLIISYLPEGDPFYPEDQITDLHEREIAADLIRASALILLKDEVPHAIAIRIDEYTERNMHGVYIAATIFVERDSQKGIVIGKGGKMLKRIGTTARLEIESMSGRKAYLRLRVKVRKNWRNDEKSLLRFGFQANK